MFADLHFNVRTIVDGDAVMGSWNNETDFLMVMLQQAYNETDFQITFGDYKTNN